MSTHGCTAQAVSELSEKLAGETTAVNLKTDSVPLLAHYDHVIIGGSIHAGQIQKRIKEFCIQNLDILLKREVGLFICCMYEGQVAAKQLHDAYPPELMDHAKATAVFGGGFNFEKMNFIEKLVVKKVAKVKSSVSNLNHHTIDRFAGTMAKNFNPFMYLA
jgi:menaquinone-dependent protoporphyrinogen oxidase